MPMRPMLLSVVIPNYKSRRLLEKNLPAVLRACLAARRTCPKVEIIVVDDASTDDSVAFLKKNYPQIRLVVHSENLRFAAACNSGVAAAQGKIVVLLNNDVAPEKDFLKPLLTHFDDPKVFSVGCLEKDIIAGKTVFSGRAEGEFKKGFLIHWRAEDQMRSETLWAAGGSMAVDRQKWLELGGLDRLFRPAYWEDIDLSWWAHKKGWKILFEPRSVVVHHHESTNVSAFGRPQMKTFAYKNQFLFVWKNGSVGMLASHLFWLPYHFFKAATSADWLFFKGFALALKQLPEAIANRIRYISLLTAIANRIRYISLLTAIKSRNK